MGKLALTLDGQSGILGKNNKDGLTFCEERNQETTSKSSEDMTQALDLFRKYLFTKTPPNLGKTNEEESEATKKVPPRPLVPQKFEGGVRQPTLLERAIIPELSKAATPTLSDDRASAAQLTIFYGGVVSVYDDVPLDKAQAIMLLAGNNSLSAPNIAPSIPITDVKRPPHPPNLPSICKFQAELPIARKYSLRRFLEKRRGRVTNKSPYASSDIKYEKEEEEPKPSDDDMNKKGNLTLSPFPSCLGHNFLRATKKGC